MKSKLLFAFVELLILQGCSAQKAATPMPKPGWKLYTNDKYNYEIQYPEGFDLWPTGLEEKRDGASIRIALKEHQAPVPVLDIQIDPRTSEEQFSAADDRSTDLSSETETVTIGGISANQVTYRWKSNQEIAFVYIYLNGVIFRFDAPSGLQDFHTSQWWEVVSTFRFIGG